MDQYSKLLTISIAAYNVGSFLERTLASLEIEEELFALMDIIIVDDGSNDETAMIADGFESKHPGTVRVIHKENGGYGSTVNTSIEKARGQFFRLLDGDDTFDRAGLEGLLRYLRDRNEEIPDLVISPLIYGRRGADSSELCDRHKSLQTVSVRLEDAELCDGLMMFEMCVRTDVLRRSGVVLTEHCYYTDNEYVMAAELYASDAVRYPVPVYRYSIGLEGQSMSVEGRRQHYEDKIRAAMGVFDIYGLWAERNGIADAQDVRAPVHITGARKLITDKLLSTMVREVYVSLMIQERPAEFRDILRLFDSGVQAKWPYVYKLSESSRLVSAARKAKGPLYPALCFHVLRSESRRVGAPAHKHSSY